MKKLFIFILVTSIPFLGLSQINIDPTKIVDVKTGIEFIGGGAVRLIDTLFVQSAVPGVIDELPFPTTFADTASAVAELETRVLSPLNDGLSGFTSSLNYVIGLLRFNQVNSAYNQISPVTFIRKMADDNGSQILGTYEVTLEDNSTFNAFIERDTVTNLIRLRQDAGDPNTDPTWNVIALPQKKFRVNGFNAGSGSTFYVMIPVDDSRFPVYEEDLHLIGKGSNFHMTKTGPLPSP